MWRTEDGRSLGSEKKVHRIVLAQDALTRTEESVYDILWGTKTGNGDRSRTVRMGQTQLSRESRLAARNAKEVVARLIQKGFIEISRPPDIEHRIPAEYRVYSYAAVLKRLREQGRNHTVRISTGVYYAFPEGTPDEPTPDASEQTPDALSGVSSERTPDKESKRTPDALSGANTIGSSLDSNTTTTSPEVSALAAALFQAVGSSEDGIALRLLEACRKTAPDITVGEIEELIRERGTFATRPNSGIRNPLQFLVWAVPKRCEGESFRLFRQRREEDQARLHAIEARQKDEMEAFRAGQQQILDDPGSSEEDLRFAREYLGI